MPRGWPPGPRCRRAGWRICFAAARGPSTESARPDPAANDGATGAEQPRFQYEVEIPAGGPLAASDGLDQGERRAGERGEVDRTRVPADPDAEAESTMLVRLLIQFLRPYARQLAAVVAFQIIGTTASLYLPNLYARIIDRGVALGDTGYIL